MNVKMRKIEVDVETADLLEARAAALGMSVSALLAEIAGNEGLLPPELAQMRAKAEGPWSPEAMEKDAFRLAEFERTRMGVPGTTSRRGCRVGASRTSCHGLSPATYEDNHCASGSRRFGATAGLPGGQATGCSGESNRCADHCGGVPRDIPGARKALRDAEYA